MSQCYDGSSLLPRATWTDSCVEIQVQYFISSIALQAFKMGSILHIVSGIMWGCCHRVTLITWPNSIFLKRKVQFNSKIPLDVHMPSSQVPPAVIQNQNSLLLVTYDRTCAWRYVSVHYIKPCLSKWQLFPNFNYITSDVPTSYPCFALAHSSQWTRQKGE